MPATPPGAAQLPGAIDALAMGNAGQAASNDKTRADLEAFMGSLRDLDAQIQQVMGTKPNLAPITQQMRQLIKRAVQEVVKTAPQQTDSSAALPTAGA